MKLFLQILVVFLVGYPFSSRAQMAHSEDIPKEKIQILLIGYAHWGQLENGTEEASMFSKKKQASIKKLSSKIEKFKPDAVMVELAPEEQKWADSLYNLYRNNKIGLKDIEYGSGETYQIGFRLAKNLNLDRVNAIDFDTSTSQNLLKEGENYKIFEDQLKLLQNTARPMASLIQKDSMSLYQFAREINKTEMIELTHRLIFNLPAYVQNGDWNKDGVGYRELTDEEKQYAGAEYISMFYNRNLKIYSNILNTQLRTGAKRIYLMMGQAHIGVLKDLIKDNPNYEIVDTSVYLN